jgi:hypothetical protein
VNEPSASLCADDQRRFGELLPWYVNGTLEAADRAWVESTVAASAEAAQQLAEQQALCHAVQALAQPVPAASDPSRWLRLLGEPAAAAPAPGFWQRMVGRGVAQLSQWLARPQWAMAAASVVVVQAALIAWMALPRDEDAAQIKSTPVAQASTLRVRFVATASEAQIRAALTGAQARIVGGPTQLGEYWVASSALNLDELKAALSKSAVIEALEVDRAGPNGQ